MLNICCYHQIRVNIASFISDLFLALCSLLRILDVMTHYFQVAFYVHPFSFLQTYLYNFVNLKFIGYQLSVI